MKGRLAAAVTAVALAAASLVWSPSAAADPNIPPSIAADCSVDVSAEIQAWIDSLPDGSTAEFTPGACYWTELPILVKNRANLTIVGNGATFQAFTDGSGYPSPDPYFAHLWPRKRTRFTVLDSTGVTISDVVLRGGNPNAGRGDDAYVAALEAQHGVEFVGSSGGGFFDSEVYDTWGDFAYLQNSHGVTVADNYMRRNGRQGIAVSAGTNLSILRNDLAESRRSCFDVEANVDSEVVDGVVIEGNVTGPCRLLWFANAGQSHQIRNITIRGNTMLNATGVPVIEVRNTETTGKRGPYVVEGNTFVVGGSPNPAFRFRAVSDVTFRNNTATLPASRAMTAVRFIDVDQATVHANMLTGAAVDYLWQK